MSDRHIDEAFEAEFRNEQIQHLDALNEFAMKRYIDTVANLEMDKSTEILKVINILDSAKKAVRTAPLSQLPSLLEDCVNQFDEL